MHYYQFNIADYQSHTKHLTPIEDICYRRLLDWQYMHEKPITTDIHALCRLLMLRDYSTDVEQVLNEFFTLTDLGWISHRAFEEIDQYRDKSKKASEAGKASAAKRSLNKTSTNNQQDTNKCEQTLNERSTVVQPTINQEPLTNKPIKEKIYKKENPEKKTQERKKTEIPDFMNDVTEQTYIDFKQLRKAKKAPITERAIQDIRREAAKASISLENALIECCARGWQGFKAEWHMNQNKHPPPKNQKFDPVAYVNRNRISSNENKQNHRIIDIQQDQFLEN